MARTTVKDLEQVCTEQAERIEQLYKLVEKLATQDTKQAAKPAKPAKPTRPWWGEFPTDYGTAAQRVEWEKLVERAKKQREDVAKALGTESVKCFIPVPKAADKMPHSIKWTASYSK